MKTKVCISIDTEFSIGGALNDPDNNSPVGEQAVECFINGRSNGLGYLLDIFEKYSISATFFLETLCTHYFGVSALKNIADKIAQKGHDIQLHLHPVWELFSNEDWKSDLLGNRLHPNDSMAGRTEAELKKFMDHGIKVFHELGLPRPIAIRTGNLHVDENVYSVMQKSGFTLASNVGLAIAEPPEGMRWRNGRHLVNGIMEVPVFSYHDIYFNNYKHLKCMTITGCSISEIKYILWKARKLNIAEIIILTHPSEYIKCSDVKYASLHRNRVNQNRLNELCKFLSLNKDNFETVTFAKQEREWTKTEAEDRSVNIPLYLTLARAVKNKINDTFCRF